MIEIVAYITLILLGGGMGLPMGIPPGPEDPLMVQIAPENCAFYASWSGVVKTDPKANPTEKWLSQPKTSQALVKLRKAYRGFLMEKFSGSDSTAAKVNKLLVDIIDASSVNPTAVYVDKLSFEKKNFGMGAGMMAALGDYQFGIEKQFNDLFDSVLEKQKVLENRTASIVEARIVNGEKRLLLDDLPGNLQITITIRDKYFAMGIGDGALDRLAANAKTPAPKWLTEMRSRLAVERIASVGYLDVKQAMGFLESENWTQWIGESVSDLFEDAEEAGWISGLDANGFLTRSEIITDDKLEGFLSVIDLQPIPERFLDTVPADSTVGIATRISTEQVLELLKDTARRAKQEDSVTASLAEFQKVTGVSLEEELLESVGDFIYAYYRFDLNNWNSGWAFSVRIEDEMSFPAIFEKINRGLKKWIKESPDTEFKLEKHGLHEIYSVINDRPYNSFAWCVVDDQWYFARNAADLKNQIDGPAEENRFLAQAGVKEIFAHGDKNGFGGPVMIAHLNLPNIFEALRPFQNLIRSNQPISDDFDFNWNDIPPIDELVNEVSPNYLAVYRTKTGFQILQRQTYPASSPPVTLAAAAFGGMPTQLADLADRAKLKAIGKAHLDFEKKYKHLCAPYSTDANKNLLLSWRVHLLPFLGHEKLYEQFRLDEPWNSAHNFPLADQMPDVFRHGSMELKPNHTVYMVLTRVGAAFGNPPDPIANPPRGWKLADIKDGAENTMLAVELDAKHQVCWTKPEDTQANGRQLLGKILGIRDSRIFYFVLLNGEVHQLGSWSNHNTIDDLIQRNDGNKINLGKPIWSR